MNIQYKPDRAVVPVTGVIDEAMMLQLVAAIRQLYHEYFYLNIELEVNSPGGQAMALAYCVSAMDALRAQGVRFTTRALMAVSSAGANLVSLGDVREAQRGALFVYHQTRVGAMETVTVQSARQIVSNVNEIDGRYLSRLARQARRNNVTRPAWRLKDFTDGDWETMEYLLLVTGAAPATRRGKPSNRRSLLQGVQRHMDACLQDEDDKPLKDLYQGLFELDTTITAALALELRLVDVITGQAPRKKPRVPAAHLCIPEWAPLYPHGQVPRSNLCRHTLVLGETGAGKTVSGVLPVAGAVMAPENRTVGCALIIDPKREIKPYVKQLQHDGVTVHDIDVESGNKRPVLNLMAGDTLSVDEDLEHGRFLEAARKILIRSASLSPTSPARVLAGLPGNRRDGYWESEGSRLAMTVTALALLLTKHRRTIYGDAKSKGLVLLADEVVRGLLLEAGAAAGVVECGDDSVFPVIKDTRDDIDIATDMFVKANKRIIAALEKKADLDVNLTDTEAEQLEASVQRYHDALLDITRQFVKAICDTERYKTSPSYRRAVKRHLDRVRTVLSSTGERDFAKVTKHNRTLLRNTMKAVHRAALYVLPDENIRPAPNVLALANRLMTMWFGVKKGEPQLAEHIVGLLKQHIRGGDAEEVYRQVEQRWAPMSKVPDPITYLCIMGFARTALVPYADATPAHTLYFGCEPYFRRVVTYGRCDAVPVDFSGAVEAEQARTVYIFQPRLDGNEALIARALKATWFEAILSSRKRSRAGHSMPLAAYIADEFHRFVTADKVHGEQSFLDTCRSFGVCCVLACQSISSMEHALEEGGESWQKNRAALDILLNNTANKLFFRSTDPALQAFLDRLCPPAAGLNRVTQVRPPSTLQPGECYASLTDGRFERRQLLPFTVKDAASGKAVRTPA